ncbi:MAG: hypothetical protein KAU58_01680 [Candidatus Omnitrophica bacterium]|nr:hypothetical protein [Candidatus Omnitrophota bacterium]
MNFVIWISCFAYAQETDKFVYDSHGKRDPFIPLVGLPHIRTAVSEIMSIDDVDFQGIARDARGRRIVIINGEMLTRGSELGALKVSKITDSEAIVIIREKEYSLKLYEKQEK